VKVNEIEPRFEAIESRLIAIESEVGGGRLRTESASDGRVSSAFESKAEGNGSVRRDTSLSENEQNPRPSAGEASEDATFPTAQKADIPTGLKADIQADLKVYDANTVGQALLHKVCIRNGNRNFCRSEEMEIETGDIKRVQPFKLTDAKFNVLTREMLDRVLAETEVDKIEWRAEEMDCEKIARKFCSVFTDLGIDSVGRVLAASGEHAFVIALVQDGASVDVVFIEPQTDAYIEPVSFDPASGVEVDKYNMYNASMIIS